MAEQHAFQYPWVIFKLKASQFAVSAEIVRSMVNTPNFVTIHQAPPSVRGVINLRDRVIPLIDLRVKLGMPSLLDEVEEFCTLMDQREQDHKNWLTELESSVKEKRSFELARDPHKCAFGKWYDNFKAHSYALSSLLGKFDAPHKKIHSIADEVDSFVQQDDFDTAYRIIEECRGKELSEMLELFDAIRTEYRQSTNEITLVLEHASKLFALAIDSIESVEQLKEDSIEDAPETFDMNHQEGVVQFSGRRKKDDSLVFILNTPKIMEEYLASPHLTTGQPAP